ncbi:MAG: hypothetical protein WBQ73_01155, partial [Candidatus Babeliales bacterium]
IYSEGIVKYDCWPFPWEKISMWAAPNKIKVFLYTIDDKHYLEISPIYQFIYEERPPLDPINSLETYMRNYKPYGLDMISIDTARQWLATLDQLTIDARIGDCCPKD